MFKIKLNNSSTKPTANGKRDVDEKNKKGDSAKNRPEKIEICYFCHQKFNINQDDISHYKYGKFPMCTYCSEFYGFYSD